MDNFEQIIEKERARLGKLREDLLSQQAGIATQLAEIAKELGAISAYEKAKSAPTPRTSRAAKPARMSRGGKRAEILLLLTDTPEMSRSDFIEKLGIKGNKAKEQSLSNVLATMKKSSLIGATDGKYRLARGRIGA